jgi:hypothetical protein
MEITSAQYENDVVTGDTNVNVIATIDGITMSVPTDTANRHYAEILRQVAEGTLTIADAE